jgi:hypothetical protein
MIRITIAERSVATIAPIGSIAGTKNLTIYCPVATTETRYPGPLYCAKDILICTPARVLVIGAELDI